MSKKSLRFQQISSALLMLAAIGLAGWLSTQYKHDFDWTYGKRNSLSTASLKQLKLMKGDVQVLDFAPTGPENRAEVAQFFNRYQQAKKNLTLEFVDPIKNPAKVKEYNIEAAGDLVLLYDGRRELIRNGEMGEANVTRALQRLTSSQERFVVFLNGHGEHDINGRGASGYSSVVEILKANGLKSQGLNLATLSRIPDNTAVLVVAGPSAPFLEGETKLLVDYVANGGHLLWLSDPDTPPPPDALVKILGVTFESGTAVFPDYAQLTGDPGVFITLNYPKTPVTEGLSENTLFPLVTSITSKGVPPPSPAFKFTPFLQSTENAWIEKGPLTGEIGFEAAAGDIQGPLTLGLLLNRDSPNAKPAAPVNPVTGAEPPPQPQQRLALLGDSDWLTNAVLGQAGNTKLALNLVRWLASRDDQLGITVPEAPDQSLELSAAMTNLITWSFLVLLPLGLLLVGIVRWQIRRRR